MFLDVCQQRCGAPSLGIGGVVGLVTDASLAESAAIISKAAASDGASTPAMAHAVDRDPH